jgi:hypothetical protein
MMAKRESNVALEAGRSQITKDSPRNMIIGENHSVYTASWKYRGRRSAVACAILRETVKSLSLLVASERLLIQLDAHLPCTSCEVLSELTGIASRIRAKVLL